MSCSKKERHMSCYYTIVKSELIYSCMKGEADTCGGEKCPLPSAQAQTRTHAQYQKWKKNVKKGESNLQPWDVRKEGSPY